MQKITKRRSGHVATVSEIVRQRPLRRTYCHESRYHFPESDCPVPPICCAEDKHHQKAQDETNPGWNRLKRRQKCTILVRSVDIGLRITTDCIYRAANLASCEHGTNGDT